jgi:putative transposase
MGQPNLADPEYKQSKKADLEMLEISQREGLIHLKYLDESGFRLESGVSYGWIRRGMQKCIEQPKKRGTRISILGLLERGKSFIYGLVTGGFRSKKYIEMMNAEADRAKTKMIETGCITVVILDNYILHKSKMVKEYWASWEAAGLYFFFLPPYSAEMNRIEDEWHQLKNHELAGRSYEDEYELVKGIIEGVKARGIRKGYITERYTFNPA